MKVAPGQQYGKGVEQRDAQRAVPMAGRPVTPAPTSSAVASRRPPPGINPGELTPLDAPSARPGEPVTSGMSMGAGSGPEVLGGLAPKAENGVEDLAPYLPMLEFMASQPNASSQTRNFVRRLRGAAPVK